MNVTALRRFAAMVDAQLHAPRAAAALGIPLPSLYASIDKLEAAVGHPLIDRQGATWRLTEAGALLLDEANRQIADAPPARTQPTAPAGGKAKASKGKGRAPIVKGQPKPYKKRQGR